MNLPEHAIADRTEVGRNLDVSNQINQSSQAIVTKRGGLLLIGNELG